MTLHIPFQCCAQVFNLIWTQDFGIAIPIGWCLSAIVHVLWTCPCDYPVERLIYNQAWTAWLMCRDVGSVYPNNFLSSYCYQSLWKCPRPFLHQSTHTTWCFYACASWLGWYSSASKPLNVFVQRKCRSHVFGCALLLQTPGGAK